MFQVHVITKHWVEEGIRVPECNAHTSRLLCKCSMRSCRTASRRQRPLLHPRECCSSWPSRCSHRMGPWNASAYSCHGLDCWPNSARTWPDSSPMTSWGLWQHYELHCEDPKTVYPMSEQRLLCQQRQAEGAKLLSSLSPSLPFWRIWFSCSATSSLLMIQTEEAMLPVIRAIRLIASPAGSSYLGLSRENSSGILVGEL